jgi:hypothetical protein
VVLLNLALASKDLPTRTAAALQADATAQRAASSSEDPFDAWYNMAVIAGLHNNGPRAEQCLRAAIAANPNWYKPHWTLAQVLLAEGRSGEARSEAVLAADLGGKHREVMETAQALAGELLQR